MTSEEIENFKQRSIDFAKQNKKLIGKELTDTAKYPSEHQPVSVFMAGSPGAGKTESSKWLVIQLTGKADSILRIDTDELRRYFPEYMGNNAFLFQGATSIIAEKMHDYAIENQQSFIFDGTFSNPEIARKNIKRSLEKKRPVSILYVYQDPVQAWEFVKERAKRDGRHVPRESFIDQYFKARETVNSMKQEFPEIKIYLLVKNIYGGNHEYRENIDNIDNYLKEMYTRDDLNNMLL